MHSRLHNTHHRTGPAPASPPRTTGHSRLWASPCAGMQPVEQPMEKPVAALSMQADGGLAPGIQDPNKPFTLCAPPQGGP